MHELRDPIGAGVGLAPRLRVNGEGMLPHGEKVVHKSTHQEETVQAELCCH